MGRWKLATVADHISPHRGDLALFHAGALQSLCSPCHSGQKARLERGGQIKGCDAQGRPLSETVHWNTEP